MVNVFQNSFITISASRATKSDCGLFSEPRPPPVPVCFSLENEDLLGIRKPLLTGLAAAYQMSGLVKRGWILQERILSPAILHFGKWQMYWECKSGTLYESRSGYLRKVSGLLRNFQLKTQGEGLLSHCHNHFIVWHEIVQWYSMCELTFEHDRLSAIAGLAQQFEQAFGVRYLAGLWKEDLHRGLLWSRSFPRYLDDQESYSIKPSISPSWSWIGCVSQVSFQWDHTPATEWDGDDAPPQMLFRPVNRLNSESESSIVDATVQLRPDLHQGATKGSIQMWAVVKRAVSTRVYLKWGVYNKWSKLATLNKAQSHPRRHKSSNATLFSVLDVEQTVPMKCYCLIVADWRCEAVKFGTHETTHKTLRYFLILRRARKQRKHHHPDDLGVFERIGIGAADISLVEQFFGSSKRKFLTII
jgi:hypothetical protein